ncbi:MAG: hypothetical protein IMZ55_12285 [Acidobacteria bacterium]|nr:hypothetical protein [Acidobacteriota bacterium]
MAVGSVLGLNVLTADAVRSPVNEWGLYDPEMCGYGAILASLGTIENREAEPVEEDPAELLLRQQARPPGMPCEALEPELEADSSGPRPSAAAAAVATCRVAHFAPLALWARLDDCASPASIRATFGAGSRAASRWMPGDISRYGAFADDDLTALLGQLALPAQIASTRPATGCRIRQVRIAPAPDRPDVALLPDQSDAIDEVLTSESAPIEPVDLEVRRESEAPEAIGLPADGALAPGDHIEPGGRCEPVESHAFEDERPVAGTDTSDPASIGLTAADSPGSTTLHISDDSPDARPVQACSLQLSIPRRARVAMALG